jgi:3-hydroxyacyl-[acyl-carrier-protein] dehydratase
MLYEREFYKIIERTEIETGKLIVKIRLNQDHEIFSGHFPENPITPGVTSIRIIGELLENHLSTKLRLKEASNIKFPGMIQPQVHPEPVFEIKYEETENQLFKVSATIFSDNLTFVKFAGFFSKAN